MIIEVLSLNRLEAILDHVKPLELGTATLSLCPSFISSPRPSCFYWMGIW
jgi:hypothetical protein